MEQPDFDSDPDDDKIETRLHSRVRTAFERAERTGNAPPTLWDAIEQAIGVKRKYRRKPEETSNAPTG